MNNQLSFEVARSNLIEVNAGFRSLCEKHRNLDLEVDRLNSKPYLTSREEQELKKMKRKRLQIRDRVVYFVSKSL